MYATNQQVNNKNTFRPSHRYYNTISASDKTINADLTAELCKSIEIHLGKIGNPNNTGAILIVDNNTGGIVSNACFPFTNEKNEMDIAYFAGSVKKTILAYAALAVDPSYANRQFKGKNFSYFLQWSDDDYAASLLKDLMLHHQEEFKQVLEKDFGFPFTSSLVDAYFQTLPDASFYTLPLNSDNYLYRIAIGQEKPYMLSDIVKWYARISSGKRLTLHSFNDNIEYEEMSLDKPGLVLLRYNLGLVIKSGTASEVGKAFQQNGISQEGIFGKTGTAELEKSKMNRSSTLVICTSKYSVGIRLNGVIPENNKQLAAQDLMIDIIPILRKYEVL